MPAVTAAGPPSQSTDTPGKSPYPKRLKAGQGEAGATGANPAHGPVDGGNKESQLQGLPQAPLPEVTLPAPDAVPETQPRMEEQTDAVMGPASTVEPVPLHSATPGNQGQKTQHVEPVAPTKPASPEKQAPPRPVNLISNFNSAASEVGMLNRFRFRFSSVFLLLCSNTFLQETLREEVPPGQPSTGNMTILGACFATVFGFQIPLIKRAKYPIIMRYLGFG